MSRPCRGCGHALIRRLDEPRERFDVRQYCDSACRRTAAKQASHVRFRGQFEDDPRAIAAFHGDRMPARPATLVRIGSAAQMMEEGA